MWSRFPSDGGRDPDPTGVLARGFGLESRRLVALEIAQGGIDADLLAQPDELPPHQGVGVAELGDTTQGHLVERGVGADSKITEDLVEPIGN